MSHNSSVIFATIDYYAITTAAENGEEGLGGGLIKREEAEKMADEMMPKLPRWQE